MRPNIKERLAVQVNKLLLIMLIIICLPMIGFAQAPPEFSDPQQEVRYWQLLTELRCLVCQNQTLADSGADLAGDLRQETLRLVREGATDEQIIDYMTARYGDFILYSPPFKAKTLLLWLGPLLGLFVVATFIVLKNRRRFLANEQIEPLTKYERNLLDKHLLTD